MIRVLVLLLTMFSVGVLQAATETVTVSAEGYGNTADLAVGNALTEASRQAGGVSVILDPAFRRTIHDYVIQQGNDASVWTGKVTTVPEPQIPTLGNIRRYQVSALRQVSEGLWQATVEADVLVYQSVLGDRSGLPSLVVDRFTSSRDYFVLNRTEVLASSVLPRLRDDLVDVFSRSGRFRVLDREHSPSVAKERNILSQSLDPAERAKQARVLGADLLLVGLVEDFSIGTGKRLFYGARFNDFRPRFRVRYRLIETATGEVVWSNTFVYDAPESVLRDRYSDIERRYPGEPEQYAYAIYPEVARAIGGAVIDVLYPLEIISMAGADQVYISQGEGRLAVGDQFSAYRKLTSVVDPNTGASLPLQSESLATIEVLQVQAGYGIGRVLAPGAQTLQVGDRLAPLAPTPAEENLPPRRETPGSSETPIQW